MVKIKYVDEIHKKKQNFTILDVRTPSEYKTEHIKGSINIPLDEIKNYLDNLKDHKKDLAIICRSGNRSKMACKTLHSLDNAYSIEGGITAWKQHNFEITKGPQIWDLERQVRFTAGFIVLIGVILGFLINQNYFFISGFVGVGLMFASITNTCAMGLLISKMPWNKSKSWKEKAEIQLHSN